MSTIIWDKAGEKYYETGVKNCVLYPHNGTAYGKGVAWNGITSISESPSGAESTDLYADDIKYLSILSAETFGATIEAYTYPDEFMACDGTSELADGVYMGQQGRSQFGLCYRTTVGNDETQTKGYKLHIIYGAKAAPSERAYSTINDSPEAITFSWEINTTPVSWSEDGETKTTSIITIDSTKADPTKLKALEAILYGTNADSEAGTEDTDPKLPTPQEIATLFASA